VCDAFFYRGKDVAVLGGGEYALREVDHLQPVVGSVTVLTNGAAPSVAFESGLAVIQTPIASLYGTSVLEGVELSDGAKLPVSGLFVALGSAAAGDLARRLGAEVEGTRIVVDEAMKTAVAGLFAAGDCTGGLLQVATAVAEGAKAALSAIEFLRQSQ